MLKRLEKSLTGTFTYVFPEDDAVDQEHDDFDRAAYEESLDLKHLPMVEGGQPTKFVCKHLPRKWLTIVLDLEGNEMAAAMACIQYGLIRVEDANPIEVARKSDRVTDKSLNSLHEMYGVDILTRVGGVVLRQSRLSPL